MIRRSIFSTFSGRNMLVSIFLWIYKIQTFCVVNIVIFIILSLHIIIQECNFPVRWQVNTFNSSSNISTEREDN